MSGGLCHICRRRLPWDLGKLPSDPPCSPPRRHLPVGPGIWQKTSPSPGKGGGGREGSHFPGRDLEGGCFLLAASVAAWLG